MNLLIVNDEIIVAQTMKEEMPWECYGISNVYLAFDAAAAKDLLVKYKIDIILCDIEMSEENGISLLRWIRGNQLEVECIFLTCHAEFIYAQEAITLGCQDYLLIPVEYETIGAAIQKLVNRIQQSRDDWQYQKLGRKLSDLEKKTIDALEKAGEKESSRESQKSAEETISQVVNYIIESISDSNLSVNGIAEYFSFHPVYLNRYFRKIMGISIGQFIIDRRMKIAATLLKSRELSVNEVSEKVGYKYYENFHTIFKKKYGCSPRQYLSDD